MSTLFAIGTKVKLVNTGDVGVITDILGDGIFSVFLEEEDMEIPAFADNLERIDKHKASASVVKGKQPKPVPEPPKPMTQYKILTRKGLLLAFVPILQTDGTTKSFDLFLINDTPYDAIFEFEFFLNDNLIHSINKKLAALLVFPYAVC
ncbi:MAG: hypothetical protein HC892_16635 [Saprospiraceae bacterium]|nr:hypothetical protein [Saprospiraceae bacterium]